MTAYYLILKNRLGKEEDGRYFLFENAKWIPDTGNVIRDRLMGYDPCEPEDSPYRTVCLSIMDQIEQIPEDRAVQLINEQIICFLKEKWKKDMVNEKEEWDKKPGWPAKLVSTEFTLNGIEYKLGPRDIGLNDDCWDQGFMETFQGRMEKDLIACGATKVYNHGFLD